MLGWLHRYLAARRARADRVAADAAALTARFGASAYGIADAEKFDSAETRRFGIDLRDDANRYLDLLATFSITGACRRHSARGSSPA